MALYTYFPFHVYSQEALRKWKNINQSHATYGDLLHVFLKAGQTKCAEALYEILYDKSK